MPHQDKILQYGEKTEYMDWVSKRDIINLIRLVTFLQKNPEYMYFDCGYEAPVTIKYHIREIKNHIDYLVKHISRMSKNLDPLHGQKDLEASAQHSIHWWKSYWKPTFTRMVEYAPKLKAAKESQNTDFIKLVEEKRPFPELREYKTHCIKLRLSRSMKEKKAKPDLLA